MIGICAVAGDSFSHRDAVKPSNPGIQVHDDHIRRPPVRLIDGDAAIGRGVHW